MVFCFIMLLKIKDMSLNFKRKIENFDCEHCGASVFGNGYTNHCPECLWSKHVDKDPGDRAEPCGGLMKPHRAEVSAGEISIIHKCISCKKEKRNKRGHHDNELAILKAMETGR